MPKPRSIDPSFWDDPDIATLTRDERLLLVGMITSCADDEGRLLADPGYLRKRVFGYDDDVSRQDVEGWRVNIVRKCRNVKLYEAGGQAYIWFANWQKHQNMRYVVASKLPAYTEDCEEVLLNKEASQQFTENYGKLPLARHARDSVALSSVNVALSGEAAQSAPPTPISSRKRTAGHPIPPDFTISPAIRQRARAEGWARWIDIDKVFQRFVEYWTDGEGQGKCKKNWDITLKNWLEDEANKAQARGHVGGNNGVTKQSVGRVQLETTAEKPGSASYVPGLADEMERMSPKARGA